MATQNEILYSGGAAGAVGATDGGTAKFACLICEGTKHRAVFTEKGVDILSCQNCGHVFSSFRGDPHYQGFWGESVAPGLPHYWSRARAKMHGDFFSRFIEGKSGKLLDMGSGLGFFVKAMSRFPAWDAHGCEISPAAVKYAREQLGLRQVTCSRLQDAHFERESFDVVTMWDVLDHIIQPDPLISHCNALLKQDGLLFIRTPNIALQLLRGRLLKALPDLGRDTTHLQPFDHFHHYSPHTIRILLERNGFTNVELIHLHPIRTGSGWKAALINPAKAAWFHAVRALAVATRGQVNFDNLFIVARKGAAQRK